MSEAGMSRPGRRIFQDSYLKRERYREKERRKKEEPTKRKFIRDDSNLQNLVSPFLKIESKNRYRSRDRSLGKLRTREKVEKK